EIELEENIRREDLSWPDRCRATSQLMELRKLQAEKTGRASPTVSDLAAEVVPEGGSITTAHNTVRRDLILARHLDDEEVLNARTADEGFKILKRKEAASTSAALGVAVGRNYGAHSHQLYLSDCLDWMAGEDPNQFDVILTDPPYGMGAGEFNDSGGKTLGGHTYDDSYDNWLSLMGSFAPLSYRLAKPQAHAYVFADLDNFHLLRDIFSRAGWKTFRTPLVWYNPTSIRAPWPDQGPQRKYQI